ncbi:hypothetical protein, partial [Gemmatimonas sp.]|uniref:hypothetical protein n=1 Tax=Gemmatimonas sp. TaxID=1962908 RepID=UPI003565FAC3
CRFNDAGEAMRLLIFGPPVDGGVTAVGALSRQAFNAGTVAPSVASSTPRMAVKTRERYEENPIVNGR